MHIGFLQTYFSRESVGGAELHTESLARALEVRGHDVTIFTDEPRTRRDIAELNVKEYPTPAKFNPVTHLALGYRAFDDMKECDVAVLTDNSAWRGVDLPIPTVMVFHVVWHGWIRRLGTLPNVLREKPQVLLHALWERKIANEVDRIVSISPNVREDILTIGNYDDKVVSISNGVDVDRFHPEARESRTNDFTVYYQGRLVDTKNPDALVEAAAISDGDWELHIGGDGSLRERLRASVQEHGLEDRVELLGYVPDSELPRRYAEADVFTLPSDYEGMPLSVLEAAASGTAIVASSRAATDFVTDEMGAVVEPNPTTLANTLDNLAANPEKVAQMGNAAGERALNHSWDSIAAEYEALFEEITSQNE